MKRLLRLTGSLLALGALTAASKPAFACGGLFCSAANPVEQSAERIVFVRNGDNTLTSIIEIQYEGPSERFAWLLPIPGRPEVAVSTVEALNAIDQATAPQFQLEYVYGDECQLFYAADAGGLEAPTAGPPESDGAPGIDILDSGTAGPYDYVTIRPQEGLEDPAQEAIQWLTDNDYDVGATGPDVLRPYLAEGLSLIAFKLTKGQDVGAIRPVQLTYTSKTPSIPIRPTAVAAKEDMRIRVFLLDEARAVPNNYFGVEINEARINWFDWTSNYDAVITEAANEANGNAFVTEFAGSSELLKGQLWRDDLAEAWDRLQAFDGTAAETMFEARFPFRSYQGFRRAVEKSTTLPTGVTMDEFAADPIGIEQKYGTDIADRDTFLAELEAEIVEPLQSMQSLVDAHPYLSRLYTTMSADEMELDPSFVVNGDLTDVSNIHRAKAEFLCTKDTPDPFSAPWLVTLQDGTELRGVGRGAWLEDADTMPAATSIVQFSGSGPGKVLDDRSDEIADQIDTMMEPPPREDSGKGGSTSDGQAGGGNSKDDSPSPQDDAGVPTTSKGEPARAKSDDGCSVGALGNSPTSPAGLALLGLALGLVRRQRRPERN